MRRRPLFCKECGTRNSPDTPISYRGLCIPCAEKIVVAAAVGIHERSGEYFERWEAGMLAGQEAFVKREKRRRAAAERRRRQDSAGLTRSPAEDAHPTG